MTRSQTYLMMALGAIAAYFIFLEGKSFVKFIQPLDKNSPAPQTTIPPGASPLEYA